MPPSCRMVKDLCMMLIEVCIVSKCSGCKSEITWQINPKQKFITQ